MLQLQTSEFSSCPANSTLRPGSTSMTHIAIQDALDGKIVEWMEHVTDEDRRR
jgi:hypothetical protein